jgi:predicted Zn-dependent peptidase
LSGVKTIAVSIRVKAGSRYEPGPSWGAFHLLEHAISAFGTAKYPSSELFRQHLEDHGINVGLSTSNSEINIHLKAPDQSLSQVLELIDELLFHPLLDSPDLANEIKVIDQEYQDKWSSPYVKYHRQIDQKLYGPEHPYIRDGLGQPDYVKTLTSADLQNLHRHYFVKPNIFIGASGNVPTETVLKHIDQILSNHLGSAVQETIPPTHFDPSTLYFSEAHSDSSVFHWFWPNHGDAKLTIFQQMEYSLLRTLLGDSQSSRLFKLLRTANGLVYRLETVTGMYPLAGYFGLFFSADPTKYLQIRDLINAEIAKFVSTPIPEAEFSRAINYLNLQINNVYDSPDKIASSLSGYLLNDGRWIKPEEYLKLSQRFRESSIRQLLAKLTSKPKLITYICSRPVDL